MRERGTTFHIKLKNINLSIHPYAEPAYLYSKEIKSQYHLDLLTTDSVKLAQTIHPLVVVPHNSLTDVKNYLIISGWIWLDVIEKNGIDEIQLYKLDQLDAKDIDSISWLYLATLELTSFNRKENFNKLQYVLAQLEQSHIEKPILTKGKKVTDKDIEYLSSETRAVIRRQKNKYSVIKSPIEDYVTQIRENE